MISSSPQISSRLGALLVRDGHLTESQLERVLVEHQRLGRRLGSMLTEGGYISEPVLTGALAEQAGVERIDLTGVTIEPAAIEALSPEMATRHKALPIARSGRRLSVAMAAPFDQAALDVIRVYTGCQIHRYFCPEAELVQGIRRGYGSKVDRMVADLGVHENGDRADGSSDGTVDSPRSEVELQELASEPSVVNLVNLVLLEAIDARASDVHIEPFEKILRVKCRIDGVLHEMSPPPRHLHAAVVSRIKIMGGMNIAERFVPQDGHISFNAPHGTVDIRVATVPTVFGESVAMRLLDRSVGLKDLDEIGMPAALLSGFKAMLARPHGIILVTGPTGSGKTTTLYAALNHVFSPEKKIITIEDPVEYQLDGVNQIPVNRKRGIDFAGGLRAILRQDPDVIMVGEIRDRETADIAIRSALTGHLVFSTLHTNEAAGAVTRLLDMGVEPYLLGSCLEGVLAQRLVREVCPYCKTPYEPEPGVLRRFGRTPAQAEGVRFYHGTGCNHCRQQGVTGRSGLFELLRIDRNVQQAILDRGHASDIISAAPADHQPMLDHGFDQIAAGVTSVEEVLRVTRDAAVEIAQDDT